MTFTRANVAGWALYEVLTSAQMNLVDIQTSRATDGYAGGTYNPSASLTWNNALIVSSVAAAGANVTGLTVTGKGTSAGVSSTGGATNGIGVVGTGGATNGDGVNGIGTGAGSGVHGLGGGTSGVGTSGQGGAPNGNGIQGLGVGSGTGIVGTGGATNGVGGAFTGTGSGHGVTGVGGVGGGRGGSFVGQGAAVGVQATGGAGAAGIQGIGGAAAVGGTFQGTGAANGIYSIGGGTNGSGAYLVGGATNGIGVEAVGVGSGDGGVFTASGTGAPIRLAVGAPTAFANGQFYRTSEDFFVYDNGTSRMIGTIKAAARVRITAGSPPTVTDVYGYNVGAASTPGGGPTYGIIRIPFTNDFTDGTNILGTVSVNGTTAHNHNFSIQPEAATPCTYFDLYCYDADTGVQLDMATVPTEVGVLIFGELD